MATPFVANPGVPNYSQVVEHREMAQRAIGMHFSCSNPDNLDAPRLDVERQHRGAVRTQELRDMMALVAFLEACFRLDYASRKRLNLKDRLSKPLIKLFNRKNNRAKLMEDIIAIWRQEGYLSHHDYSRIHSVFRLRHWIAHGQYWQPQNMKWHDFLEVAEFIESLINSQSFESDGIDLSGLEIS